MMLVEIISLGLIIFFTGILEYFWIKDIDKYGVGDSATIEDWENTKRRAKTKLLYDVAQKNIDKLKHEN